MLTNILGGVLGTGTSPRSDGPVINLINIRFFFFLEIVTADPVSLRKHISRILLVYCVSDLEGD